MALRTQVTWPGGEEPLVSRGGCLLCRTGRCGAAPGACRSRGLGLVSTPELADTGPAAVGETEAQSVGSPSSSQCCEQHCHT